MMNFDHAIDRTNTAAEKWDDLDRTENREAVIPLWVADMDFPSPPAVVAALEQRARHPVYGYTHAAEDYHEVLAAWHRERYGLDLTGGDFIDGPGTVPSLGIAVRALSKPGDGVLICTPVYHPFFDMIRFNGREVVEVPMELNEGGRYSFSREDLEAALKGAGERGRAVPLAIFCSPHNPGGTVWEREELERFLGFARDHAITVVADEIHRDFVYPPKTFTSIMALSEYDDRIIGVSGANKSFNLGGLPLSHFMVRDPKLSRALQKGIRAFGGGAGLFAQLATETAYRSCGPYLDELLVSIQANLEAAVALINAEIPGVRAYKPEGTYLIWADASECIAKRGLRDDIELADKLEQEGRVKCTAGSAFGSRGRGFLRINAACPRAQLMEGLERMKRFVYLHD